MDQAIPYAQRRDDVPVLRNADEYDGQPSVRIAATQLGPQVTRAAASRTLDGWVDFFEVQQATLREVDFVTRTPRRLFEALGPQVQLTRLQVKWGDCEDLVVLAGMSELRELVLSGAARVRSLVPLASLGQVGRLVVEGLRDVSDLSPVGEMGGVVDLELGGDWMGPRSVHVESIRFLDRMPQLRELVLHSMIVDDRDYSPLMRLPNLRQVRVASARGMRPALEELKAALPWSG